MKPNLLKTFVLLSAVSLILFSCKKDKEPDVLGCTDPNAVNYNPNATKDNGSCVSQSTIQSLLDNTIAERIFAEVFPVVNQVGLSEAAGDTAIIKCATITSSGPGYPKTMTIDYGPGPTVTCTCDDGFKRKNQIIAIFDSPWSDSSTFVTISLVSYDVLYDLATSDWMWLESDTFKIIKSPDGMGGAIFSQQVAGGKCHWKGVNNTWNDIVIGIASSRVIKQVSGEQTDDVTDDVFRFEGTANGIDRDSVNFESVIFEGSCLNKRFDCQWVTQGTMHVIPTGGDTITINFGDGTCNDQGSVEMSGGNSFVITLN
ncbi:MAG: hypothetical protein IIA88_09230 [Bacteroidetes bacterium]|nr:hypothetical protein [Bacteroidota bacterium]